MRCLVVCGEDSHFPVTLDLTGLAALDELINKEMERRASEQQFMRAITMVSGDISKLGILYLVVTPVFPKIAIRKTGVTTKLKKK